MLGRRDLWVSVCLRVPALVIFRVYIVSACLKKVRFAGISGPYVARRWLLHLFIFSSSVYFSFFSCFSLAFFLLCLIYSLIYYDCSVYMYTCMPKGGIKSHYGWLWACGCWELRIELGISGRTAISPVLLFSPSLSFPLPFWYRVSLCSPNWPWTHTSPSVLISQMLRLQVWTTWVCWGI